MAPRPDNGLFIPEGVEAPAEVRQLAEDRGWVATWAKGRQTAAVFNPTAEPLTLEIPWSKGTPKQWSRDGHAQSLATHAGQVSVTLPAGESALLEE